MLKAEDDALVFCDRQGHLREYTHLTLANSVGFIRNKNTKGTKVYDTNGPGATSTSWNNDWYITDSGIRNLTIRELNEKKCHGKVTLKLVKSLRSPVDSKIQHRVHSQAIPMHQLAATYLTLFEHEKTRLSKQSHFSDDNALNTCLLARTNEDKDKLDLADPKHMEAFLVSAKDMLMENSNLHEALAAAMPAAFNNTAQDEEDHLRPATDGPPIRVERIKHVPKVSVSEFAPLVNKETQPKKFAKRTKTAMRYHAVYHHSPEMMELAIRANPKIMGCKQGDSRYLLPCEWCKRNKITFRKSNDSSGTYHENLDKYGFGEHFYLDSKVLTVIDKISKCKYFHMFVAFFSEYIFHQVQNQSKINLN